MFRTVSLSETCRGLFQKNKFEKLVHLVGFVIRINHDARSSECQIQVLVAHDRAQLRIPDNSFMERFEFHKMLVISYYQGDCWLVKVFIPRCWWPYKLNVYEKWEIYTIQLAAILNSVCQNNLRDRITLHLELDVLVGGSYVATIQCYCPLWLCFLVFGLSLLYIRWSCCIWRPR
jgi:hypothetical protein